TVGFVVRGQDYGLRTHLPDIGQAHAACDPPRFGLITHRSTNPAPFAGHHGPSLQLRPTRLFARGKERIAVDVHNGTGECRKGERFHIRSTYGSPHAPPPRS